MPEPIQRILIVGGGTAGWMTAAFLARVLGSGRHEIVLVESEQVASIGVGEATVPPLVGFLEYLGIDETEFLVACRASYKLGIVFTDWLRPGVSFWHPFGRIGGSIDGVPAFHHWLRARSAGRDERTWCAYSLQALLGELGKAPRPPGGGASPVTHSGAYAYHLDAGAFAAMLARRAIARGVRRIVDDVRDVLLDESGAIARITTAQGLELTADLYVDCTGFHGLLVERALGDPWLDWSDQLLCDRATVLALPPDGTLPPYTRSTALDSGWVWRIPLRDRIGCGYVHASRFTSAEAATAELRAWAGPAAGSSEPRQLEMRVGRRQAFWMRNCVAIGLSAGFVEPLESTGLFLIQTGLELLAGHLPDASFNPALIRHYNQQMAGVFDEVRDFLVLHYVLAGRDDTPFWRASREIPVSDALAATLALFDETGLVDWDGHVLFGDHSFHAIAAGSGRLPRRHLPQTDLSDLDRACAVLARIRQRNAELAAPLPDHRELIAGLGRR